MVEIENLKVKGEYQRALELCRETITEFSDSEAVLREVYNYSVFITNLMGEDSTETAREALTLFPDLAAGDYFPGDQNLIYDSLRREMYGSLVIKVDPDTSLVFLDSEFMGKAPLDIPYLTAGQHFIEVSHEGFESHADSIFIDPGRQQVQTLKLERQGGTSPWLIGGIVAAVGVVVYLIVGGDDPPPDEEPLPDPPDPPTN